MDYFSYSVKKCLLWMDQDIKNLPLMIRLKKKDMCNFLKTSSKVSVSSVFPMAYHCYILWSCGYYMYAC